MVSSIIVPLIFWLLISSFAGIESVFLPSPLAVIQALGKLAEQGFLIQDTITSFLRVVGGFFLGGLFAIPLGILMGTFPSIRSLMEPCKLFPHHSHKRCCYLRYLGQAAR